MGNLICCIFHTNRRRAVKDKCKQEKEASEAAAKTTTAAINAALKLGDTPVAKTLINSARDTESKTLAALLKCLANNKKWYEKLGGALKDMYVETVKRVTFTITVSSLNPCAPNEPMCDPVEAIGGIGE